MKTFFRVFGYAKKLRLFVPQYIVFVLLSVIFSAFNVALLIPLLNVLFKLTPDTVFAEPASFEFSIDYVTNYFNYYFFIHHKTPWRGAGTCFRMPDSTGICVTH